MNHSLYKGRVHSKHSKRHITLTLTLQTSLLDGSILTMVCDSDSLNLVRLVSKCLDPIEPAFPMVYFISYKIEVVNRFVWKFRPIRKLWETSRLMGLTNVLKTSFLNIFDCSVSHIVIKTNKIDNGIFKYKAF